MTAERPLDVLQACGVPAYEVMMARERHPYIARLIAGATLREYQAHLIPWGGMEDLSHLYGEGVLLAGDAGRFVTKDGGGSWPAIASGVAADRAVRYACEKGGFSKNTLAIFRDLLEEEGLIETQHAARRVWDYRQRRRVVLDQYPEGLLRVAVRCFDQWLIEGDEHLHSM